VIVIRSVFAAAWFVGLATMASLGGASAQNATADLVAKAQSLPDMALGSAKASVIITEYASMSCPHCAAFGENVFPMLKSKYIDTGKVRFVFREFPLDIKAAAASMLARCIANNDAEKYFGAIATLFQLQDRWMAETVPTLQSIGQHAGMSEQAVTACETDQALVEKIVAGQKFALDVLKVDSTPTFFINGEVLKGSMAFEDFEKRIKPLLKK
jgi:protein-disulfide isomerase